LPPEKGGKRGTAGPPLFLEKGRKRVLGRSSKEKRKGRVGSFTPFGEREGKKKGEVGLGVEGGGGGGGGKGVGYWFPPPEKKKKKVGGPPGVNCFEGGGGGRKRGGKTQKHCLQVRWQGKNKRKGGRAALCQLDLGGGGKKGTR